MSDGIAGAAELWGGFRIGAHEFALPITTLREVAKCTTRLPLPSMAACVVGGCDLRGTLVPVLDLRQQLGLASDATTSDLVLLLGFGDHVVGLAVDTVTGTFAVGKDDLQPLRVADRAAPLVLGCLRRPDNGRIVSALSATALAALPDVPMAFDRERRDAASTAVDGGSIESLLLLRCGDLRFAVDALQVQSTLWEPRLQASALESRICRGVVEHRGHLVPAIDLPAITGIATEHTGAARQGFVLQTDAGLVVFLVEAVTEIARVAAAEVLPLPPFAFRHARLLRGVCMVTGSGGTGHADHLVVDLDELLAHEDVQKLAAMNTRAGTTDDGSALAAGADAVPTHDANPTAATDATDDRRIATLDLGGAFGIPLEQLSEVLPIGDARSSFGDDNLMRTLLVSRRRSIPVVDLRRLLGTARGDTDAVCVLVVRSGSGWIGFAAPALRGIEPVVWEQPMPAGVRTDPDDIRGTDATRRMAMVGTDTECHVVEVLDLLQIASRLRDGHELATAST